MKTQTLLIESVFCQFSEKEILQGVSVKAETGLITGILGRNGCGKSTVLKILFGTQNASESFIFWNGNKIKKVYTINGLVNYLPQNSFLPKGLSVKKVLQDYNVSYEELISHFPEFDLKQRIDSLSGGQRRILEVFIIIKAPTLFSLLDEPFTHIMPLYQNTIRSLVENEKYKKGFIVTDHLYNNLFLICDSIQLIKECKSYTIQNREALAFHGYIPFTK